MDYQSVKSRRHKEQETLEIGSHPWMPEADRAQLDSRDQPLDTILAMYSIEFMNQSNQSKKEVGILGYFHEEDAKRWRAVDEFFIPGTLGFPSLYSISTKRWSSCGWNDIR